MSEMPNFIKSEILKHRDSLKRFEAEAFKEDLSRIERDLIIISEFSDLFNEIADANIDDYLRQPKDKKYNPTIQNISVKVYTKIPQPTSTIRRQELVYTSIRFNITTPPEKEVIYNVGTYNEVRVVVSNNKPYLVEAYSDEYNSYSPLIPIDDNNVIESIISALEKPLEKRGRYDILDTMYKYPNHWL